MLEIINPLHVRHKCLPQSVSGVFTLIMVVLSQNVFYDFEAIPIFCFLKEKGFPTQSSTTIS